MKVRLFLIHIVFTLLIVEFGILINMNVQDELILVGYGLIAGFLVWIIACLNRRAPTTPFDFKFKVLCNNPKPNRFSLDRPVIYLLSLAIGVISVTAINYITLERNIRTESFQVIDFQERRIRYSTFRVAVLRSTSGSVLYESHEEGSLAIGDSVIVEFDAGVLGFAHIQNISKSE